MVDNEGIFTWNRWVIGVIMTVMLSGAMWMFPVQAAEQEDPGEPVEELITDVAPEFVTEIVEVLPGETQGGLADGKTQVGLTDGESVDSTEDESGDQSGDPGEISEEADSADAEEVVTKGIRYAADYKEVFDALKSAENRYYYYDDVLDYAVEESADSASAANSIGAARKAAASDASATGTNAGTAVSDYSTTNLRDDNVDEADIVKTDGRYIYILKGARTLLIAKADGPDTVWVSETDLLGNDEDDYDVSLRAEDMYVDGDRLVIILSRSERVDDGDWSYTWKDTTQGSTWDISDRQAPFCLGSVWQDGVYKESRKTDDKVYLYSVLYRDVYGLEYPECRDYLIPKVNDQELKASQICIPEYVTQSAYLLVSSLSIDEPDQVIDTKAVVSGTENVYVTTGSLYVMDQACINNQDRTEIVKFTFEDDGTIQGRAAARVKGYINDTFSIDEYDGNLRVLTTYMGSDTGALLEALSDLFGLDYYADDHWTRHNALYILDENLQRRARLSDIAENEEIRSARYFGDTVYFVTFRNTDPLFTADLSDPDHPKLTGALKISGFSAYLHPYGEGRLLGIGYEADEDTGRTTGLKLSMFDVSDPANVKEIDRFVLDGITWCPAIEDYKAILANGGKNLIGFYCDDRYMVFRYDEETGFARNLLYDFYEDMLNGNSSYNTMRGLYIGEELYLAGENYIVGFDFGGEDGFVKNLVLKA